MNIMCYRQYYSTIGTKLLTHGEQWQIDFDIFLVIIAHYVPVFYNDFWWYFMLHEIFQYCNIHNNLQPYKSNMGFLATEDAQIISSWSPIGKLMVAGLVPTKAEEVVWVGPCVFLLAGWAAACLFVICGWPFGFYFVAERFLRKGLVTSRPGCPPPCCYLFCLHAQLQGIWLCSRLALLSFCVCSLHVGFLLRVSSPQQTPHACIWWVPPDFRFWCGRTWLFPVVLLAPPMGFEHGVPLDPSG